MLRIVMYVPKPKCMLGQIQASKPNKLLCIDFLILDKSSSGIEDVLQVTYTLEKFSRAFATKNSRNFK